MTAGPGRGLIHVVGRAQPGDPVTASARALCHTLGRLGHPGRLVASAASTGDVDATSLEDASEPTAIVHTVDGGEALLDGVPALVDRRLTLVHHGSAVGSDRRALRMLRGAVTRAAAADAAAREELRGLGFGHVRTLDPRVIDAPLDEVPADRATADNLARHPGPMILAVGPLGPGRSLEVLIDAFAELITSTRPAATLSLCGPSSPWYMASLRRRVAARGLVACEVIEPSSEGEVVARLERADVLVNLRPTSLDPYLRSAASRGVAIVAPLDPRTAALQPHDPGRVASPAGDGALAAALHDATAPRTSAGREPERDHPSVLGGAAILRALAIP